MMEILKRRLTRAVEGLLENESLTADLEDATATELVRWGVAWVEKVIGETAGLPESQAQESADPQLRAIRRLMRVINNWVSRRADLDAGRNAALLDKIIEQVALIQGDDFHLPVGERRHALESLYQRFSDDPRQMVVELRRLLQVEAMPLARARETQDATPEPKLHRPFGGRLDRTGSGNDQATRTQ